METRSRGRGQKLRSNLTNISELFRPGFENYNHMRKLSSSSASSDEFAKLSLCAKPPAILARKMPAGTKGRNLLLESNIYPILMPENTPVFRYEVEIEVELSNKCKVVQLTKNTRDDFLSTERKNKCMAIFLAIRDQETGIFGGPQMSTIYDRGSALFSLKKIDVQSGSPLRLTLSNENLKKLRCTEKWLRVTMSISTCKDDAQFIMDNFGPSVDPNLDKQTRNLRQFLEIATSQEAILNNKHVIFGSGKCFLLDPREFGLKETDLGEGKYMAIGADKGVRFIEGERKNEIQPAIAIDTKKSAFHYSQPVIDTVASILLDTKKLNFQLNVSDFNKIRSVLKDLRVRKLYGNYSTFSVYELSKLPAGKIEIKIEHHNVDGGNFKTETVSLRDHYRRQYGIELRYLNLPCISAFRPNRHELLQYPIELLEICDNQRVPKEKQTPQQMQKMIRESAVRPEIRRNEISRNIQALCLSPSSKNETLKNLGISIAGKPINVSARQLLKPTPKYGRKMKPIVNSEKGNWDDKSMCFFTPASIPKWAVLVAHDWDSVPSLNVKIERFLHVYRSRCIQKGLQMDIQTMIHYIAQDIAEMNNFFRIVHDLSFVLYVEAFRGNNSLHGYLKLCESKFEVITQQVNMNSVLSILNDTRKVSTLDNIIRKTNEKNYGLNYRIDPDHLNPERDLWLSSGKLLIVAWDVCHPPPQSNFERRNNLPPSQPSVVGFSFNTADDPQQFVGDFRFQAPRKEQLTAVVIQEMMERILAMFEKSRNHLPSRVVIYRDGVSEGQYSMVMTEEMPPVRDAFLSMAGPDYKPQLTTIIATKRHNRRFFVGNGQNPPPGIVVDTHISRPDCTDFYLLSHRAVQGTAKATEYTVPVDDSHVTMDDLQSLTHALTCHHQIVPQAISLPEPVYQADEWAKRGKNLFNEYR